MLRGKSSTFAISKSSGALLIDGFMKSGGPKQGSGRRESLGLVEKGGKALERRKFEWWPRAL